MPLTLFYGGRSAHDLFHLDYFERLGVHVVLATEDGSRGEKGRVTVPLERALQESSTDARVLVQACGPEPMLAAVARLTARYGRACEVSVERVMGCGLGGCYSLRRAGEDRRRLSPRPLVHRRAGVRRRHSRVGALTWT